MRLKFPTFIAVILVTLCCVSNNWAQKVSVETLFTGEKEPKAIELPLPEYPELAKKDGIHGTIVVPVTIDEEGNAQAYLYAAFGPYPICPQVTEPRITALRNAAKKAAQASKFTPIVVDGKPVKVRGQLIYTFTLPDKNESEQANGSKATTAPTKENASVSPPKGSFLKGTAISLPKPPYPEEARPSRAAGKVDVRVLIDEKGNVYSAEAVSGQKPLRLAAETAACKAIFSPTLLSGEAVKVTGIIAYNFVP